MKKILCSLALLILMFTLVGCAKCIGIETSTVQVKVTDEYYEEDYTEVYYNPVTKISLPKSHPAVYSITVEYDGTEYNISGRDTYNKYSDKIGEYVNALLETTKYDDGTVRYDIISLE